MSDYDRGGYPPQSEPPLAFDPRGSRSPRRAPPTTLIISAVVLGLMVVGVAAYYRSGVRHAREAPQVVGQPLGPMRGPAPASAQPVDDGAGLQVYNSEKPQPEAASSAAAFAPEPEAPASRPAPRPETPIAALPTGPVASAVHSSAPPKSAKPAAVTVAAASSKPAKSSKPAASSAAPAAVTVASATPAKPAAATPAVKGAPVVQIGAFSSAALADKGWNDLARAFPGDMVGKGKSVSTVDKDGTTFFRTFVTGFSSRAEAQTFCGQLKTAGKSCIVK